jgi:hypothetical protein
MKAGRKLEDLISVGPAMLRDFELLGIKSIDALARQEPGRMYTRLCRITGERQDPCVLDVFSAAVAQARDPLLGAEQCQWWYWSRKRKADVQVGAPAFMRGKEPAAKAQFRKLRFSAGSAAADSPLLKQGAPTSLPTNVKPSRDRVNGHR